MKSITINYSHEFISNKIADELILNDIIDYKKIEESILKEIETNFSFNVGKNRNINTLSGGQRSVAYLITLKKILTHKGITSIKINLVNILESLSENYRKIIINTFKENNFIIEGISAT